MSASEARLSAVDRGQRITLIKRLAGELAVDSLTNIDLTLRQFELPTAYYEDERFENKYGYAVEQVEAGSDSQLTELQRHLFPDDPPVSADGSATSGPWAPGMYRLFVSHTTAYRGPASRLRDELHQWGVEGFVAHEAIEPTREWQDEIESALRTCDAMCVMVTPDFVASRWCDQEVGFAVARGILVVPLKMSVDPHGFIAKYQAIFVPEKTTPYDVADRVFDALARNPKASRDMAPAIARRYSNSGSADNTRAALVLLETIPKTAWTDTMIEQVDRAPNLNSKVGDALLPGGRPVPEAADRLLVEVRAGRIPITDGDFQPVPVGLTGDDDIPF